MQPTAPTPRLLVLLRSRGFLVVAALWGLAALGLTALPLTGTPGFFHALGLTPVAGVLSLALGVLAARLEQRIVAPRPDPRIPLILRRPEGALAATTLTWAVAALPALGLLAASFGVALVSGLRVGTCDLTRDLVWYPVLPIPSAALGAAVGVLVGAGTRRRRGAVAAAAGVLLASAVVAAIPILTGPQAFGFDALLGYVPGPLYDEAVHLGAAVLGWRALTLAWIGLVLGMTALFLDREDLRLRARPHLRRRGAVLLVAVAAVGVAGLGASASELGFRQSDASVAAALGGRVETAHFVIHYPKERDADWVRRAALDHELRYRQLTTWLKLPEDGPKVVSWIFRSSEEKRRLIGAGPTSIAKPWLNALYVDDRGLPEPILEHELAHVLAARFGRGPFRVATSDGVIPNDGLVEGLAVAAAWPTDALTVHGWARAMRALGVAPAPESLFARAAFWRYAPSRSYTLAGSFLRWLADTHGIDAVKKAYTAGRLSAVGDPAALFAAWERFLDAKPVDAAELRLAEARFRRPSIVRRPCALDVSHARAQGDAARAEGRPEAALAWYGRCVDLEPQDPWHLARVFEVQRGEGDEVAARATAERILAHPKTDARLRARMEMALGDLAWEAGEDAQADRRFAEAALAGAGAGMGRLVAVKRLALASPELGEVLRPFLLGRLPTASAVLVLHEDFVAHPDSGLLAYLLGRQLYNVRDWPRAARWLTRARDLGLTTDGGLAVENLRLLGRARYEAGDLAGAEAAFAGMKAAPTARAADRVEAADWMDRCRFEAGDGPALAGTYAAGGADAVDVPAAQRPAAGGPPP